MTTTTTLTACQSQVLAAVARHYAEHGYGPSLRDLCDALGIASTNGVVCHLDALERKGKIVRAGGSARAVLLPEVAAATRAAAEEYLRGVTG